MKNYFLLSIIMSLILISLVNADINTGLVRYYTFDDLTGIGCKDNSTGINGTYYGNITKGLNGILGYSILIEENTTKEYVKIENLGDIDFNVTNEPHTFSFLYKIDSYPTSNYVTLFNNPNFIDLDDIFEFISVNSSGTLWGFLGNINDGTNYDTFTVNNLDTWYHLLFRYNTTILGYEFFINSTYISNLSLINIPPGFPGDTILEGWITIANSGGSETGFKVEFDDFRVYNRTLNNQDIEELFLLYNISSLETGTNETTNTTNETIDYDALQLETLQNIEGGINMLWFWIVFLIATFLPLILENVAKFNSNIEKIYFISASLFLILVFFLHTYNFEINSGLKWLMTFILILLSATYSIVNSENQ